MQYHIQTTPIWDSFKSNCDCPLCQLYEKTNAQFLSQYLSSIMEPSFRIKTNKIGFCNKHIEELYAQESKLELALLLETRTDYLLDRISTPSNPKAILKLANSLKNDTSTCAICDDVAVIMKRYAYTIAQMYSSEKEFPSLLGASKGFCMPHFILLLENAGKAGKKATEYATKLIGIQKINMAKNNENIRKFINMFDHASNTKNPSAKSAIPSSINKIHSRIVK